MLSSFETTYALIGLALAVILILASGPGIVLFHIVKFFSRGIIFVIHNGLVAFFFGTERDTRRYRDPIMDIIVENPVNSMAFVRKVICVASLASGGSTIPCIVYLALNWTECRSCDKPLRWWLLIHCVMSLLQLPLRLIFSLRLRYLATQRIEFMTAEVHHLTSSQAWCVSKTLSLSSYAWFVVGLFWTCTTASCVEAPLLLNAAVAVIMLSLLRLFLTLGSFYYYFPTPPSGPLWTVLREGGQTGPGGFLAGGNNNNGGGLRPLALQRKTIDTLPLRKYEKIHRTDGNSTPSSSGSCRAMCPICLNEFDKGDLVRDLPKCKHPFHSKCIDQWLMNCGTCPLCQRPVS